MPVFLSVPLFLTVTIFYGGTKLTTRYPLIAIVLEPIFSSTDLGHSIGKICNFLLNSLIGGDAKFVGSDGVTRCRMFLWGDYFGETVPFSLLCKLFNSFNSLTVILR